MCSYTNVKNCAIFLFPVVLYLSLLFDIRDVLKVAKIIISVSVGCRGDSRMLTRDCLGQGHGCELIVSFLSV